LDDRLALNAPRKKNKPRKLKNNKKPQVVYQERTNFNLILNKFKKAEKNMPAPSRKKKRLRKYPLFINNSALKTIIKTLPNIQKKINARILRERTVTLLPKNVTKTLLII